MRRQDTWAAVLASCVGRVLGQGMPTAEVQNNTFNASHGEYNPESAAARIAKANLSAEVADAVLTSVNFERSNWAGTSVRLDPFYADLPSNWTGLPAGSVLKVEQNTSASLYTVAPTLAISRLLFTTKTFNGTVVPASAYVLWPWLPRGYASASSNSSDDDDGLPVIAWGHGTSGQAGECAPSHIRTLWYEFMIFSAATQGYAVVAPDYAGLGLDHDGAGNFIPHQYLANQASGNDLLYAVKAAQQAWPGEIGSRYVVMGHSQGGGAAWGAANVLAQAENGSDIAALRQGYLGTVAGSPWTSLSTTMQFSQQNSSSFQSLVGRIATGVQSIFPSFSLREWLTDKGARVVQLMQDLQGCQAVSMELLTSADLVRPDWRQSWYADAFDNLTTLVGRPFAGPMLVIQGTGDPAINAAGVSDAVDATCAANPAEALELVEFDGVGHTAVMFSGQQVWLDWIDARFAGKEAKKGCQKARYSPVRAVSQYLKDRNYFLEWSQYQYGTA
ncbi:hypothetical protein SLS62_006110 [Diatrype stigma]|uniref:AB hydrolase-1 domain-containing protein n=1 Tax=Diatrype stigma TaxID=117547 RepID=A0AAN9YRK7_9PEZI